MLEELHIKNLALIREARLDFGAGLTVLSGETGAGKTVLLSALKLAMGDRADNDAIRRGADEASVAARFYFDTTQEELIVSRSISQSGRSRTSLNDEMVTVKALKDQVGMHIDLHGQHDHQSLLRSKTHLKLLDTYIGAELSPLLENYRTAREEYIDAKNKLEELQEQVSLGAEEVSLIELILSEIDRVNPVENEDEILSAELPSLVHAEEISRGAGQAWQSLSGEGGAYDLISHSLAQLRSASEHHKGLSQAEERLRALLIEISDLGETFKGISQSTEFDEAKLDHIQERLMKLDSLKKRFGPSLEMVLKKKVELYEQLSTITHADDALIEAGERLKMASEKLTFIGSELQDLRVKHASSFVQSLKESVSDLALENARFELDFKEYEFESWPITGPAELEILYSSSVSSSVKPLAKIASGGELSRVMLGLKSILGRSDETEILVFDEIDAGIGGATALAVGKKLSDLAKSHQILVVTHLAQVAAFADAHFVVKRTDTPEGTDTQVECIRDEQHIREIARMLSGEESQAAIEHARELIRSTSEMKLS